MIKYLHFSQLLTKSSSTQDDFEVLLIRSAYSARSSARRKSLNLSFVIFVNPARSWLVWSEKALSLEHQNGVPKKMRMEK